MQALELMVFLVHTLQITWTDETENVTVLLQLLNLMNIPFKALAIMRTGVISIFPNHFNRYLSAFCFNCYSQLIDCCRFYLIKIYGSIEYRNCTDRVYQNPYIAVKYHVNWSGVNVWYRLSAEIGQLIF